MNKIERRSADLDVLLYRRYIDDILIIAKSMEALCRFFASFHTSTIKLPRKSTNTNGWLPILSFAIRMKRGKMETVWYRKEAKKDLMIHVNSAHPQRTKLQAVRNILHTAACVITAPRKEAAKEKAFERYKKEQLS